MSENLLITQLAVEKQIGISQNAILSMHNTTYNTHNIKFLQNSVADGRKGEKSDCASPTIEIDYLMFRKCMVCMRTLICVIQNVRIVQNCHLNGI